MSNLKLKHTPQSYVEAAAVLGDRDSMVIGHNTRLERNSATEIVATYHGNPIVSYHTKGVDATWAGWATSTTTNRLNKLAPGSFRIQQRSANLNGQSVDSYAWHRVG